MSTQQRTPSIPIPRTAEMTDSYLQRSSPIRAAPSRRPAPRSISSSGIPGTGRRASTSNPMGIPGLSPTTRSLASSSSPITNRGSPRSLQQLSTFEPRVIRADSSTSNNSSNSNNNSGVRNVVDPACLPSSSTRTRRQSGAGPGGRAPSTSRAPNPSSSSSTPHHPQTPTPSQTAFPRPAYLAHSALRHLLQTEAPPSLPQRSTPSAGAGSGELHAYLVRNRRSTITASTTTTTAGRGRGRDSPPDFEDSDEDSSNVSPPPSRTSHRAQNRGISSSGLARAGGRGAAAGAGGDEAVEYGEVMKLPTRWSQEVRCPSLSVSGDGRELTFNGSFSPSFNFNFKSTLCPPLSDDTTGPSSSGDKEAAAARTDYPIPPACGIFYYEVKILSKGQKGYVPTPDHP